METEQSCARGPARRSSRAVTKRHASRAADLPARLRRVRGDRSQAQLAEAIGVKRQTYTQWEAGKAALTADRVAALAPALGVDAAWLAFGPGAAPVPAPTPPPSAEGYGGRVRDARARAKQSQDQLAQALGFAHRVAIYQIEAERTALDLSLCERLALLLGVSPEWLAFGRE